MPQVNPLTVQQYTLDALSWTKITPPFNCNGFTIHDYALTTAILYRSD